MDKRMKLGGAAVALLAIMWSLAPTMSYAECMTRHYEPGAGRGIHARHYCRDQSSWGWKW